jgi:hypothetical protein
MMIDFGDEIWQRFLSSTRAAVAAAAAARRYSGWLKVGPPSGRSSSPGRAKNFHFTIYSYIVQTGSEVHPASYPMGTEGKTAGA